MERWATAKGLAILLGTTPEVVLAEAEAMGLGLKNGSSAVPEDRRDELEAGVIERLGRDDDDDADEDEADDDDPDEDGPDVDAEDDEDNDLDDDPDEGPEES
jgi:hypothetical protein